MIKSVILFSIAGFFLFLLIYSQGNTERRLKKELKQLIEVCPFSATGSDLMLAVFGWPSLKTLQLKSLLVSVSPQSSSKSGSATATISGISEGVEYNAEVSFTYFKSYMGGHGYSGGSGLSLSNFQRENEVPSFVCCPGSFKTIQPGEALQDSITNESFHLPDGSLANYYQLTTNFNISVIEIELTGYDKKQLSLKYFIFKGNKIITRYNAQNTGTFSVLVTGGSKTGSYTINLKKQ